MTDRLADLVRVAPRFHRSVNVQLDFDRSDALDGYVVSPLARDVALRISTALAAPDGGRAWSLTGPYGSGKSAFVTFLTSLLGEGPAGPSARARLSRAYPDEAARLLNDIIETGVLLPVLITGERRALPRVLLSGLHKAAESFWQGRGVTPTIVADIAAALEDETTDGDRIIELTLALADKISTSSRRGAGLFIVFDEMGKLLEWAALNPERSDIYLLQRLAEAAARSRAPIGVLTVLHQDLSAYAARLPRALRDEWTKVGGRFEPITYLEPAHHIVKLLAGAIDTDPRAHDLPAHTACRTAADEFGGADLLRSGLPLAECFPLHPFTALCLGPLFRSGLGQNERSLFAFLNSREPLGFLDWLERADGSRPYTLADLYDYVVANTRARVDGARLWASAEYALGRLPADAEALDAELLKAIAILSMAARSTDIGAHEPTLALATGRSHRDVKRALGRLKASAVIVYRRYKKAWELWDGSDIDVDELVTARRADILARGGIAEQVEQILKPTPITASRHYIRTGTFRVLKVRYASTLAAARALDAKNGDALLVIIVPDHLDDVHDLIAALDAEPGGAPDDAPRALTVPHNLEHLYELALDYLAASRALSTTPELENDPIARRILRERQLAARDALVRAHDIACAGTPTTPGRWRIGGRDLPVTGQVSRTASEVFDRTYDRAPQILNELVNRAGISSSAAGARRVLMQRMLTHIEQDRFGIEGHPPELSLYRSVLERLGLHREVDGVWQLTPPDADSSLAATWAHIRALLTDAEAGSRQSFEQLTRRLAQPPYGIRAGVTPILLWAWYLLHKDEVFLYEENSFVPEPDDALVERLLKQPHHIELQSALFDGRLKQIVEAIHRHAFTHLDLSRGRAPLRVVRALVLFVKRLSNYARHTASISADARKVRAAVNSARDTIQLIASRLPEALDIDLDQDDVDTFGARLAAALLEMQQADDRLLDEIENTLHQLFRFGATLPAFRVELAERATRLEGFEHLEPLTARLIEQTTALDPADDETRAIWLRGVGTTIAGKIPDAWTDADLDRFRLNAEARVRSFLAAERLHFQMGRLNGQAKDRHLIRIDYLATDDGKLRGLYGLLDAKTPEMDELMTSVKAEVEKLRTLARDRNISDRGVAYALLHAMMDALPTAATEDG